MTTPAKPFAALILSALTLTACSDNWKVTRHDPESVKDLDYRFDEDDARQVAQTMIPDALSRPWIDRWKAANDNQDPLIVVGNVKNDTGDYVNSDLFTDPIVTELLNSGRVRVKAEKDLREELRDERMDTEFNDPATVKEIAMEVNADFMLVGRVKQSVETTRDQKQIINYYQVTLQLFNIETAELAWQKDAEVEKRASR
jgi:uncharacterized protein (TIGR02722 family)